MLSNLIQGSPNMGPRGPWQTAAFPSSLNAMSPWKLKGQPDFRAIAQYMANAQARPGRQATPGGLPNQIINDPLAQYNPAQTMQSETPNALLAAMTSMGQKPGSERFSLSELLGSENTPSQQLPQSGGTQQAGGLGSILPLLFGMFGRGGTRMQNRGAQGGDQMTNILPSLLMLLGQRGGQRL